MGFWVDRVTLQNPNSQNLNHAVLNCLVDGVTVALQEGRHKPKGGLRVSGLYTVEGLEALSHFRLWRLGF